jgi:hypothetical protein
VGSQGEKAEKKIFQLRKLLRISSKQNFNIYWDFNEKKIFFSALIGHL